MFHGTRCCVLTVDSDVAWAWRRLVSSFPAAVEYLKGAQAKAAAGACPVTLEFLVREKGEANKPNNERLIAIMKEAGVSHRCWPSYCLFCELNTLNVAFSPAPADFAAAARSAR